MYDCVYKNYTTRLMEMRVHRFRRYVTAFRQPLKDYIYFLNSLNEEDYDACFNGTHEFEKKTMLKIMELMKTRQSYSLRDFFVDIGIFTEQDEDENCSMTWHKKDLNDNCDFCFIPGQNNPAGEHLIKNLRSALAVNTVRGQELTEFFGRIEMYRLLGTPEQIQSRISAALKFDMRDYVKELLFNKSSEEYDNFFAHKKQKPLKQSEIIQKMEDKHYTLALFWEDLGVISKFTPEHQNIEESTDSRFLWKNRFIPGSGSNYYFISWKVKNICTLLDYMLDAPGQMSMKTLQGISMENFRTPVVRERKHLIYFSDDVGYSMAVAANPYKI